MYKSRFLLGTNFFLHWPISPFLSPNLDLKKPGRCSRKTQICIPVQMHLAIAPTYTHTPIHMHKLHTHTQTHSFTHTHTRSHTLSHSHTYTHTHTCHTNKSSAGFVGYFLIKRTLWYFKLNKSNTNKDDNIHKSAGIKS